MTGSEYNQTMHSPLRWRHNDHDSVSNHQPHGCLLNRLYRRRTKKTSKFCVTGLCVGNSPGPVNSPHKGPVTRKMFPFDDVIMQKTSHTSPSRATYEVSIVRYLEKIGRVITALRCIYLCASQHESTCKGLVQSSAVITRSNIVSYYNKDYRNWRRISNRCWILTGELWGVFCEYLWENWPRYNGTALYSFCLPHVPSNIHSYNS